MQPTQPWSVPYPNKQPPEYQCHHDDCRRTFVRKTSLTNHLKAHQNVRSRSIYRTKRARLRAAAAARAAAEAASVDSSDPPRPAPTLPPPPPQDKPAPETSPISTTAPPTAPSTPHPPPPDTADALLTDISLALVSPLSFTPQEDLLQSNPWNPDHALPLHIRPHPEPQPDPDPPFQFPPDREDLIDPADPTNYDFLHDLYKYH